jgi:hAT family C-terminal dimerisation region
VIRTSFLQNLCFAGFCSFYLFKSLSFIFSLFFLLSLCPPCRRWRVNRPAVLSHAQYDAAKQIFKETVVLFYPAGTRSPIFVPLESDVQLQMQELQQDVPPPDIARAPKAVEVKEVKAAEPATQPLLKKQKTHFPAVPRPKLDMNQGVKVQQKLEENEEHDIEWELAHWFTEHGEGLSWETDPLEAWKELEPAFPLLALLARRFLCILPTSAASERVWSALGRIIGPQSTTIDSDRAAQLMFVRYNRDLLQKVTPELP